MIIIISYSDNVDKDDNDGDNVDDSHDDFFLILIFNLIFKIWKQNY